MRYVPVALFALFCGFLFTRLVANNRSGWTLFTSDMSRTAPIAGAVPRHK